MKLTSEKILAWGKKYKYVVLVLLIGIALLLYPSGDTEDKPQQTVKDETDEMYKQSMQEQLAVMLSRIDGAGKVEVMLTLEYGRRTEYQTDTQTDTADDRTSQEQKTVILSEGSAYDKAAVSAVRYPCFQGALIVCKGADQPSVRLNIIDAVSALTGLGSDRITVVKMN